ncbi:MAG: 16S rRNA (cytosine(1402)-N(4))-methyltransferase RsmH [Ignavibacteriales bacterium]|nr:16S rRNA (cytosine(1402)-N(4))-methyltransferase RsmH [Ignavibacteriales bacterium]
METNRFHTPVLLEESLSLLRPVPGGTYVDATVGGGGHAAAVLDKSLPGGRCIGIDTDREAIAEATTRLASYGNRFVPVLANFGTLDSVLARLSVSEVDGILFDLGVSSHQLDEPSRGFSFRADEPLDMRMDRTQTLHAAEVVNTYTVQELTEVIRRFGEERYAKRVAASIVRSRSKRPLETTGDLASAITQTLGHAAGIKSLARVFQAIRIEVNRELEQLTNGLEHAIRLTRPGGRIVLISYHSLEDRIVKNVFREASRATRPSGTSLLPDVPIRPRVRVLTRKPVEASPFEVRANARARSAKLRAAEKL